MWLSAAGSLKDKGLKCHWSLPHSAAPYSPLREPSPPAFPAELRDPGEGHGPGATEAQGGQEDGPEGQLCPGLPAPLGPQQVAAQHAF